MSDLNLCLKYDQAFSLEAGTNSRADHLENTLKQILVNGVVLGELSCWDICDLAERYARSPALVAEKLREVLVAQLFGIAVIIVPKDMPEWVRLFARLEDLGGVMNNRRLAGHFWFTCAEFNENGYGEELDNYMMEVLQRISPEFCAGFSKE